MLSRRTAIRWVQIGLSLIGLLALGFVTGRLVVADESQPDDQTLLSSLRPTLTGQPPSLDLNGPADGTDYTAVFANIGNQEPVAIVDSAALTISDPDDTMLTTALVTLTNHLDGDDETLYAPPGSSGITSSYNSSTGVLTLSGTDTIANYQQVMRGIVYRNVASSPDLAPRIINFAVSDGTGFSAPVTSTVIVVSPAIYLPTAMHKLVPPMPPVLSNPTVYLSSGLNNCSTIYGDGTEFGVAFDYEDPNGNAAPFFEAEVVITLFPSEVDFTLESDQFDGADDEGAGGRMYIDSFCIYFFNQTSVRISITLPDTSGLKSEPLIIDYPRPEGAN